MAELPVRSRMAARVPAMSATATFDQIDQTEPLWQAGKRPSPTLTRCLILAALLHGLLVALIGSAPPGSALPGQGVWGALNVVLNSTTAAPGAGSQSVEPPAYTGPRGQAQALRWGGGVRDPADAPAPAPVPTPGAARVGTWNPAVTERDAGAQESERPTLPAAPVAAAVPVAPPVVVDEPVALRAPSQRAVVPLDATAVERVAVPAAMPALPALPAPAVAPAVATTLAPAVNPIGPPPAAVTAAPPAATPAAPPAAVPAPSTTPAPTGTAAAPAATAAAASQTTAPAGAATPLAPATPGPNTRIGAGRPDAGARLGQDQATPPSAASSAPRLNLTLPGSRAAQTSGDSPKGVLQLLPRPPDTASKLARDIEKAGQPDCKKAYSGMGLLAVIPLAADAIRDKGCRW